MPKHDLPKRFFTLAQLAERWECTVEDVQHCIDIDELKTADKGAAIHGKQGRVEIVLFPNVRDALDAVAVRGTATQPHFDMGGITEEDIAVATVKVPGESFVEATRRAAAEIAELGWNEPVVLKAEVDRFETEVLKVDAAKPPAFRENSLLAVVVALLASWPKGDIPGGKDLEKAAESIGVKISDDSIRKVLAAAIDLAAGDTCSSLKAKLRRQKAPT